MRSQTQTWIAHPIVGRVCVSSATARLTCNCREALGSTRMGGSSNMAAAIGLASPALVTGNGVYQLLTARRPELRKKVFNNCQDYTYSIRPMISNTQLR